MSLFCPCQFNSILFCEIYRGGTRLIYLLDISTENAEVHMPTAHLHCNSIIHNGQLLPMASLYNDNKTLGIELNVPVAAKCQRRGKKSPP